MKIGIMGGTFDPIHMGHLLGAEQARESMSLDEIWFMPTHTPPHKANGPVADPEQRLEMVKLAVAEHPQFHVSDLELRRGGTSYTVETVRLLCEQYPQHDFFYIIGADMVQDLPKWYKIDEIVSMIAFIGLSRLGFTMPMAEFPQELRSKVHFVPIPLIELSSTVIRERLKLQKSVRYMVPEEVLRYVEGNRIYGS
ncbi:MAG: nicotinate (nicotinamide) nucleotide adenylyltransferase [Paenibacillus sp. RIFOXYA1_FULL_44_5]|nr:MAG: nicotinate (nicotinamide) nucleotide adenylyltransferase [Paenibacillus sp. RIFOXYA1_FULL_44_5]